MSVYVFVCVCVWLFVLCMCAYVCMCVYVCVYVCVCFCPFCKCIQTRLYTRVHVCTVCVSAHAIVLIRLLATLPGDRYTSALDASDRVRSLTSAAWLPATSRQRSSGEQQIGKMPLTAAVQYSSLFNGRAQQLYVHAR